MSQVKSAPPFGTGSSFCSSNGTDWPSTTIVFAGIVISLSSIEVMETLYLPGISSSFSGVNAPFS